MADCDGVCTQELEGLLLYKSTYVDNQELVCRKIRPRDFGQKNTIKSSFIQTAQLKAGMLSVWRIRDASDLPHLAKKLGADTDENNILAAPASHIRASRIEERGRSFSIINDTRVDLVGGHDQQHAAIAPCLHMLSADNDVEALIPALKTALAKAFRLGGFSLYPI